MSRPDIFLDTNILLRHLLQDHGEQSPRCSALMEELSEGTTSVLISETVIFEVVYMLEKHYATPRDVIAREVLDFIALPAVVLSDKQTMRRAIELYLEHLGLSFADCFHVAFAVRHGVTRFLTFDRRIGKVSGIDRIEP